MAEINKELLEKAEQAKSAEELIAIAKEYGLDIAEEDAAAYFEESDKSGELSDAELDNVAGGSDTGLITVFLKRLKRIREEPGIPEKPSIPNIF